MKDEMSGGGTTVELVAAVAANGVIGRGGQLPWHLPDDLRWFKSITMGRPVIMGRKTFESVGKPLPGRKNIVVSRTWGSAPSGVEVVDSLEKAIGVAGEGRVCIVGGGVLYEAAMGVADVLHLTELDIVVEGDARFPSFDRGAWRVTREERHEADARHSTGFWIRTYERKR